MKSIHLRGTFGAILCACTLAISAPGCFLDRSGAPRVDACSNDGECEPGERCADGICEDAQTDGCVSGVETCDGVDNDCNPSTADGVDDPEIGVGCDSVADADLCAEGSTVCVEGVVTCNDPSGETLEVCGGGDEDCDGAVDEAGATGAVYLDADGDGWGSGPGVTACAVPAGHVSEGGDCDDADPDVNPGAAEICNGIDDDCNVVVDDGATDCPCLVGQHGGHAYLFCGPGAPFFKRWSDAREACAAVGYQFVTVDDAAENEFLRGEITPGAATSQPWWIGLTDQGTEGVWEWADGGGLGSYSNWQAGEGGTDEGNDCVVIEASGVGQWRDTNCNNSAAYICESY